jgi:hypothetical protein
MTYRHGRLTQPHNEDVRNGQSLSGDFLLEYRISAVVSWSDRAYNWTADEYTDTALRYCTISFSLAPHVTCDASDEVLVSATSWTCRDMLEVFDCLAPQATKIFHIGNLITKWIRHLTKIIVTNVTFRQFGGPHDTWLPNWMKWYSMGKKVEMFYQIHILPYDGHVFLRSLVLYVSTNWDIFDSMKPSLSLK